MAPLQSISLNSPQRHQLPASPLGKLDGQIHQDGSEYFTASQRDALIQDLQLELNNRISRLRAHYQLAATALRSKVESRINRVPKRLWSMTLRQLNDVHLQPASPLKRPPVLNRTTAKLDTLSIPRLRAAAPIKAKAGSSPAAPARGGAAGRSTTTTSTTATTRKRANAATATASAVRKPSPVKRPLLRTTRARAAQQASS